MKRSSWNGVVHNVRTLTGRVETASQAQAVSDDAGFTLVELLIVVVILPLVIGAMSLGLISVFSLQDGVSGRLVDSASVQVVSSVFLKDVQSAGLLTAPTAPASTTPKCGSALASPPTQTQLLGLAWNGSGSSPSGFQNHVSYVTELDGTQYSLIRQFCTGGSTIATSTTMIATNIDGTLTTAPDIACATASATCSSSGARNGWITTDGVTGVTLSVYGIIHHGSGTSSTAFQYALVATPRILKVAGSGVVPSFSPLTLLDSGGSCNVSPDGPAWRMWASGNGVLSIISGGQYGAMAVGSACPGGVSFKSANPTVNVSAILSYNPAGILSNTHPPGIVTGLTGPIADPFASLAPPINDPTNPGTCQLVLGLMTCSPGFYAADPGTTYGTTLDFKSGAYYFNAGLSLGTATNSDGLGVLFYVPNGGVTFNKGNAIQLPGLAAFDGIAIWDAGTSPITLTNPPGTYAGGGIYAPMSGVDGSSTNGNTGSITTTFIVALYVDVSNNFQLYIGQ